MRATLTLSKGFATLFPLIGRHPLFAVDVRGTIWKLDKRQEMADQTSCYRESNSVEFAPSKKR